MPVEIYKVSDKKWNIIHTHKDGVVTFIILDSDEVKKLLEEFKKAGF